MRMTFGGLLVLCGLMVTAGQAAADPIRERVGSAVFSERDQFVVNVVSDALSRSASFVRGGHSDLFENETDSQNGSDNAGPSDNHGPGGMSDDDGGDHDHGIGDDHGGLPGLGNGGSLPGSDDGPGRLGGGDDPAGTAQSPEPATLLLIATGVAGILRKAYRQA